MKMGCYAALPQTPDHPNDLVGNCERFETDVILFIYFFSEGNLSVCVRCSNKGEGGGGEDAALLNLPDGEQFHGLLNT